MACSRALFVFGSLLVLFAASASARPTPWLRLHGSNTIGQRLAPALARAFAEQEGWRVLSQSTPRVDETTILIEREPAAPSSTRDTRRL